MKPETRAFVEIFQQLKTPKKELTVGDYKKETNPNRQQNEKTNCPSVDCVVKIPRSKH